LLTDTGGSLFRLRRSGLRSPFFAPELPANSEPLTSVLSDGVQLTSFLLKDRCALPDQMSFVFTFPRRRFILAIRDGDGANKNKIAVFDFRVTPKHFPHDLLLYDHRSPRSALRAVPIYRLDRARMG